MPLLLRYILTEHLKFIGMLLAAFLMIFFTLHTLEKIRWLSHAPFSGMALHFLLKTPKMMSDLMPISLLLATILTLGTLSRKNEIIPMMSAGMRRVRLVAPLLGVGGVISLLFALLQISFVPYTLRAARDFQYKQLEKKLSMGGTLLQNRIWFRLDAQRLLSTQLVDTSSQTLYDISLYELGSEIPLRREIQAKHLRYQAGRWTLYDGFSREYQKDGTIMRVPFTEKEIPLEQTLAEIQNVATRPEEMSYAHLTSYIRQLENSGLNARPYQVALHTQSAFPWANVILVLLGVSLSFLRLRGKGLMGRVALGLGILLMYWMLLSVFGALGRMGILPPVLAGWGPHLLFLSVGVTGCFHLRKTL